MPLVLTGLVALSGVCGTARKGTVLAAKAVAHTRQRHLSDLIPLSGTHKTHKGMLSYLTPLRRR